ncbi:MAG: DUF3465 domain-containing protein [Candidatus Dormibacter sp.]
MPGIALVILAACGTATTSPDDAAVVQDFQAHRSNVEVTADGTVITIFPDRHSNAGVHEQFIMRLASGGFTVEVEHNISIGARVPLSTGDRVIVHGDYIWNDKGGLIHFTHHDPRGTHEGGYIQDNGKTYD